MFQVAPFWRSTGNDVKVESEGVGGLLEGQVLESDPSADYIGGEDENPLEENPPPPPNVAITPEDEYQVRMKKEEEKKTPLPSLTDQMRKKKEENPQIVPRKPAQRRNR